MAAAPEGGQAGAPHAPDPTEPEQAAEAATDGRGGYLRVSQFALQLVGALVLLAFFLFCYLILFPAQVETPGGFGVSALLFPNSLLLLGCLFSGLLALDLIRRRKTFGYSKMNYHAALRVCIYVGGMLLYLLGLEYLGFMISSVLGILGFCVLLGERKMTVVGPLAVLAPWRWTSCSSTP